MVGLSRILSRDLKTGHSLPGLWITGSKILEISGRTLHCLEDIPRVPLHVSLPDGYMTTL